MEPQRQRSGSGRRRKRRNRAQARPANNEPVLIVARRPDSPLIAKPRRRAIAASAVPKNQANGDGQAAAGDPSNGHGAPAFAQRVIAQPARREARIVQIAGPAVDANERERQRLLDRLLHSEGRIAISKAADELVANDFALPTEQPFQLQLLEHIDEDRARGAIGVIASRLQKEPPHKKPVLDQRLRRLEEHGEDVSTREAAAALRRALRL